MLIHQLEEAFGQIKKNWKLSLLIVALDILFFFIFGLVYTLYFDKILIQITKLMFILPNAVSIAGAAQTPTASALAASHAIKSSVYLIYKLLFLLAVSVFVIWVVFQSAIWYFSHKIVSRTPKGFNFVGYLRGFSVVSIIWFALFSLIIYISAITTINSFFINQTIAEESSFYFYGVLIPVIILFYFVIVSYSINGSIAEILKKTFYYSFKKFRVFLSYIILLLFLVLLNFLIIGLLRINKIFALVTGSILLLFYFLYARIFMIGVVTKAGLSSKK
ncbi:MAG: hypothetical protein QXG86_03300 [Candidatus Woesearchaeota archaeon]